MSTELIEHHPEHVISLAEEAPDALTAFASVGVGIESAKWIATQLNDIVEQQQLFTVINGKKHLHVEAWCTCAALCGLSARTEWSRRIASGSEEISGYESRVEIVRLGTNTIVGAAEAECWLDETLKGKPRWKQKFEAKSMSQTRATSKAISQILRWIPILAGYSGTPAEEMGDVRDMPEQHGNPNGNGNAPKNKPRGERVKTEVFDSACARWKATQDKSRHTKENWQAFCKLATGEDFESAKFPGEWDSSRMDKVLTAISRIENGETIN